MDTQQVRVDSDAWMSLTATVRDIEARKRNYPPGSAKFLALAHQIEDLTRIVFELSQRQARESATAIETGTASEAVNDAPPERTAARIIDEWRDAERRLSLAVPGSPEYIQTQREAQVLRAEYKAATSRGDGSS